MSKVNLGNHTKVLCTLDLFNLFDEEENMLKGIKLVMVVDGVQSSTQTYTGQEVEKQGYILQSPVHNLRRRRGFFLIKGNAHFPELSIKFCLGFEYTRGRGSATYLNPLPNSSHCNQAATNERSARRMMRLQQWNSHDQFEAQTPTTFVVKKEFDEGDSISRDTVLNDETEFERRKDEANREHELVKAEIRAIKRLQAEQAEANLERSKHLLSSLKRKRAGH
jgi:hypothetical protein